MAESSLRTVAGAPVGSDSTAPSRRCSSEVFFKGELFVLLVVDAPEVNFLFYSLLLACHLRENLFVQGIFAQLLHDPLVAGAILRGLSIIELLIG